jgi:rhodanese-related sulfurtransferase
MKKIAAFLILIALMLCGCGGQGNSGYSQITQSEAVELMDKQSDCIILDVRTEAEFTEGHIKNAICVPNESITDKEPKQLPDKNQLILVYCRSGRRSKEAAQKLADMGYTNVREFGGINDWKGEVVK